MTQRTNNPKRVTCTIVFVSLGLMLLVVAVKGSGADRSQDASVGTLTPGSIDWHEFWGLSPEEWASVRQDGADFSRVTYRILQDLPRLPARMLEGAGSEISAEGQPWQLTGEVISLREQRVPGDAARGLAFERYVTGELRVEEIGNVAFAVREAPSAWIERSEELPGSGLRARIVGICLRRGGEGQIGLLIGKRVIPVFDQISTTWGISDAHVWLAQHGFDVGLFDGLRDRMGLQAVDRPAFHALLGVVATEAPPAQPVKAWDLTQILPSPAPLRGEWGELSGVLRRAVRVISTNDIAGESSPSAYYQLDLFVRTTRSIRFQLPGEAGFRDFGTSYPATVCVAALPTGVMEGENLRVPVTVRCFFFKLWAHDSDFMARDRQSSRQPRDSMVPSSGQADATASRGVPLAGGGAVQQWTPLFIGWPPQLATTPEPPGLLRHAIALAVVCLAAGLTAAIWWNDRDLRRSRPNKP